MVLFRFLKYLMSFFIVFFFDKIKKINGECLMAISINYSDYSSLNPKYLLSNACSSHNLASSRQCRNGLTVADHKQMMPFAFSNIKSHNENILSPWNQFKLTVDSVRPNLATQVSYRNFLYKYSLKIRSFFHNRAFKKMGWKHPDKHNKSKKKFMSFVFLPDNNVNIKVIPVQSFLSAAF